MAIYLINIFLMVFWYGVLRPQNDLSDRGRKQFCFMASFQWFILSGFRHINIGADTWYYGELYKSAAQKSWTELLVESRSILMGEMEGRDIGYAILVKLVSSVWNSYRVWLVLIAALLAYSLGKFIYKYSYNVLFSYILFSCLFYNFYAITGLRQTIATCVLVFLGYDLIVERKLLKFLVLAILMSLIHKSCLIFVPFYFLANKKITQKYLGVITILIGLSFVFRNTIFSFLAIISGYDSLYEAVEGAGAKVFTLILLAVFCAVVILHRNMEDDTLVSQWINALCSASVFVALTFVEPNTMRIVQYFSVFLMLLIPALIECVESTQRAVIYFITDCILVGLFINTGPVYYFM